MPIFNSVSYKLSRGQAVTLNILGIGFIGLSVVWLVLELAGVQFPMEPVVVMLGGLATLLASHWPWKPKYASRRLSGRISTDYSSNDKIYPIGKGDWAFTIRWSSGSGTSIHIYRDPEDIDGVAIAYGASKFSDIKDSTTFDFSSQTVTTMEGEIAVLRNAASML